MMAMFGAPFAVGESAGHTTMGSSGRSSHLTHDVPVREKGRAGHALGWTLAAGGAAAAALVLAYSRVRVSGDSMRPTLEPGDRLLVRRVWRRSRVVAGDLVTVPDPRPGSAGRLLVKRVVSVEEGLVVLAGDNPEASTDSRSFGPVPGSSIRGRVLYRYAPAGRAGRPGPPAAPPVPLPG